MSKKQKQQEQPAQTEQKQRTLNDLSVVELKALAFEIDQTIKQKQREYQTVMQVLQERMQPQQE